MAKQTQDREDLLREATGLRRRMELLPRGESESVFCGYRDNDALSIYFGPDDVMQFNAAAELRRAFWRGRVLAAYQRQLNWLDRVESRGRMQLRRTPLSTEQQREYLLHARTRLNRLCDILETEAYAIVGMVPPAERIDQSVLQWLRDHRGPIQPARHPGAGRS